MINLMYKCICRLDNSRYTIIMLLTNPRLTEVSESDFVPLWDGTIMHCSLAEHKFLEGI